MQFQSLLIRVSKIRIILEYNDIFKANVTLRIRKPIPRATESF